MTDTNPPELYHAPGTDEVYFLDEEGTPYLAEVVGEPVLALPGDAVRLVRQTEPQDDQSYRITVDVPVHLADELKDSLFTAIADAVNEWEPKDREGWDPFVSGGPADHSVEAYAERLEAENTRLHEQLHQANELLAAEMRNANERIEAVAAEARTELARLKDANHALRVHNANLTRNHEEAPQAGDFEIRNVLEQAYEGIDPDVDARHDDAVDALLARFVITRRSGVLGVDQPNPPASDEHPFHDVICRRCDVVAKYCPCEHPDVDMLATLKQFEKGDEDE